MRGRGEGGVGFEARGGEQSSTERLKLDVIPSDQPVGAGNVSIGEGWR